MKASLIEVGKTYSTKIGSERGHVMVTKVIQKDYRNCSGRVTTIYQVRSPAGNLLSRHNAELQPIV